MKDSAEDIFEDYPPGKSYEWYLAKLKKDAQESEGQEGAEGSDSGQAKGGIGNADSFDSHDQFGQAEGTSNEIAKERLQEALSGTVRYRPADRAIYEPPANSKLVQNPFKNARTNH